MNTTGHRQLLSMIETEGFFSLFLISFFLRQLMALDIQTFGSRGVDVRTR